MKTKIRLDASAIKKSGCLQRLKYTVLDGLVAGCSSFKMEYGTAFHKALKDYYNGLPENDCIINATKHYEPFDPIDTDWRTTGHLMLCIGKYFENYKEDWLKPLVINGKPLVEVKFEIPLFSDYYVEITLCGTIDLITKLDSNIIIVDHKTTGANPQYYFKEYQLSPQLLVYKTVMEHLFPDFTDVVGMINGIFLNKSGCVFKRSDFINFTEANLATFKVELLNLCCDISAAVVSGLWNTSCFSQCGGYFTCEFLPLCSVEEKYREMIIEQQFGKREYNPLKFQE